MEDNLKKFNLEVDLECTVCLEYSVSPIQSCHNGHLVCGFCWDKQVKNCKICGEDALLENGFAERLAQKYSINVPCKNFESGCKILIKSTEMKGHLTLCEYRPIRCLEKTFNACKSASWFVMREFVDHLKSHHKTPIIQAHIDGEYKLTCPLNMKNRAEVIRRFGLSLCSINGQYFLLHSVVDRNAYCWWITVLGGQTEADKYYYTTQLTSASKNIEVAWKLPVLPYHKFNTLEKVVELGQYVNMVCKMIPAVQEKPLAPNEHRRITLGFKIQEISDDSNLPL